MLGGLCHSSQSKLNCSPRVGRDPFVSRSEIMYLVPQQNAAFYLAHELGHQFGLAHDDETACRTTARMTVMTRSHTASYEQARWSTCENEWINEKICQFSCVFNKPEHYRPIINKVATKPGQRMSNNQQARMIEHKQNAFGEEPAYSHMPTTMDSRCLYFQHFTGAPDGSGWIERLVRL